MKIFGNKRHPEHKSEHRLSGLQRGMIMLAVSLLVLAGAVAALYYSFVRPMQIKEHTQLNEQTEEVFVPPTVVETEEQVDEQTGEVVLVEVERPASHKEDYYNILVAGTDDDGTRTDTIMIARMDVKTHSVALMSIPRDTVISGNYNVPKINSVYGGAGKGDQGMQALKSKLAQLLGFEVDGYALVNLNAFIQLVDLVGGVEFEVPMAMHYDDPTQDLYIHLDAGLQHLDGQKAMQLVRFRKGYPTQDLQRTQTQQLFLQALAKKCLEEVSLANIGEMANIFMENVLTDMTVGNIAYFAQELLKCDFENMFTYTLEGESVMLRGASCYAIYLNKTLEVVNGYFNPYDTQITASNVTVRTPQDVRAEQAAWLATQEPEEEEIEDSELSEDSELLEDEELIEGEEQTEDGEPDESEEQKPEEEFEEENADGEISEEDPVAEEENMELPTDDWIIEAPEEDSTEELWPG